MKRKANFGDSTNFNNDGVQRTDIVGITPNMIPPSNWQQGYKRAKQDQKARKQTVATPLWPSVGVKPNTPKVEDLESSGTPECLEFDRKAQNT